MNFVFPFWQSKIFDFVLPPTTLCFALHFSWGDKKPATGRARHQIAETSRRAVSGMREVASVNVSGRITLQSEWQRQVQRVASYYAYSRGKNNNNSNKNNSRRNSNRPRSGASSSNLACHLNELNEELINHAHISHSYATKQLAATNQSLPPRSRSTLSPVHPSHEPSINQSINCRHRFACDRKCFCQNTCSPFLAAALKYYSISAEESHWPTWLMNMSRH